MSFGNKNGKLMQRLAKVPGYALLTVWAVFTVMLISCGAFASLSTSSEIFSDHMFAFKTGFHFENYVKAWKTQKVSVFFMNSLMYTVISCPLIVVIAAPAAIDGCSPMRTFWTIMFPLAQPGIITVSIFNFITVWNEYFMSLIFANKTAVRPVAVGLYNMISAMRYTGDWGGMFASVVIVFLPTFILYLFLSEKIIRGVTGGAIKG